jgi:O-antigen ligase
MIDSIKIKYRAVNFVDLLANTLLSFFIFSIPILANSSIKILLILLSLLFVLKFKRFSLLEFISKFWHVLLFILMVALGLIYSIDAQIGVKRLETLFCLIGVPFLCLFNKEFFQGNKPTKIFTYGVLVASIMCLANAFFHYLGQKDPRVFHYYDFTSIINSHPTYLAYYIILAISWILYDFSMKGRPSFDTQISVCYLVVLTVTLVLTGGQTSLISLLLVFSFFLLNSILSAKGSRSYFVTIVTIIMICIVFLANMIEGDNVYSEVDDSWERFHLWESGVKANDNFFFGVGTGDAGAVLKNYLAENGLEKFANSNANTHNQLIEIFLSHGMTGVIAFLILVGRPLFLSYKIRDTLGILIQYPFVVYSVTEVFLGRYQGVVVFALVQTIAICHSYANTDSLNDGNISSKINVAFRKL